MIDETLTLLRARRESERAVALGRQFFDLGAVRIHYVQPDDIRRAWIEFRQSPNREWSFTDCASKVIIERLHIKQVLSFDRHFAEFGSAVVVP